MPFVFTRQPPPVTNRHLPTWHPPTSLRSVLPITTLMTYSVRTKHTHYHPTHLMIVRSTYFLVLCSPPAACTTSPAQNEKPWSYTLKTLSLLGILLTGGSGLLLCRKKGWISPTQYRLQRAEWCYRQEQVPVTPFAFVPLHQAFIFSKLDLRNTYNLVCIREHDRWKTAFNTPVTAPVLWVYFFVCVFLSPIQVTPASSSSSVCGLHTWGCLPLRSCGYKGAADAGGPAPQPW